MSMRFRVPAWAVIGWDVGPWGAPAVVFWVALGFDAGSGSIPRIAIDAAAALVLSWLAWRKLRVLLSQPFASSRRAVLDAAGRIADGRVWLARNDHMALVCHRKLHLGVIITRVPEDDVAALEDEGTGVVVMSSFIVLPMSVRVSHSPDGFRVARDGDDFRISDEARTPLPRRIVRLMRMNATGAAYAECGELTELAAQMSTAEPLGSRGDIPGSP